MRMCVVLFSLILLAPTFALSDNAHAGHDLPIKIPEFGDDTIGEQDNKPNNPPPPILEEPADDEDPRDSPLPTFYGETITPETDSIYYVVDISGSMLHGGNQSYEDIEGNIYSGTRLDRAKAELIKSISGLSENFVFNIISYNCWISRWSDRMERASYENKQSSFSWIGALQADGGTATGPATSGALTTARQNKMVILLTDGQPNCGASTPDAHRAMIRANNTQGAVINVFGISATGTYRTFCQGVAADSGGNYFDVP